MSTGDITLEVDPEVDGDLEVDRGPGIKIAKSVGTVAPAAETETTNGIETTREIMKGLETVIVTRNLGRN